MLLIPLGHVGLWVKSHTSVNTQQTFEVDYLRMVILPWKAPITFDMSWEEFSEFKNKFMTSLQTSLPSLLEDLCRKHWNRRSKIDALGMTSHQHALVSQILGYLRVPLVGSESALQRQKVEHDLNDFIKHGFCKLHRFSLDPFESKAEFFIAGNASGRKGAA